MVGIFSRSRVIGGNMVGMLSLTDAAKRMGKNPFYLYVLKCYCGWPNSVELTVNNR